MASHSEAIRQILNIPSIKWGKWVFGAVAVYDLFSSQVRIEDRFEPPTLLELLGMSGALLPWWGWLLVAQAIFTYGLFECVRRNLVANNNGVAQSRDDVAVTELAARLERLEEWHGQNAVKAAEPSPVPADYDKVKEDSRYAATVVQYIANSQEKQRLRKILKNHEDGIAKAWQDVSDWYNSSDDSVALERPMQTFNERVFGLETFAKQELGKEIDTKSYPNFLENPFTPAKGEPKDLEQPVAQEYRKLWARYQNIWQQIRAIEQSKELRVETETLEKAFAKHTRNLNVKK